MLTSKYQAPDQAGHSDNETVIRQKLARSGPSRNRSIAAIRKNLLAFGILIVRRSVLSLHMRTGGSVE